MEWANKGDWKLIATARKNSDHRGILLFDNTQNWGAKPLRVFNVWLKEKSLLEKPFSKVTENNSQREKCKEFSPVISEEDNTFLTRIILEHEMENALRQSSSEKAPGPDGLNVGALKAFWHLLKEDMLKDFKKFMVSGELPRGMNSSFISLVPKVKIPSQIKDYRPISLINCSLKILTKTLTNRLVGVMDKLISPNQTGFIKGRQISEGILITNEVVHSIRYQGVKGIILKLDFEKAFDSVE